MSGVKLDSSGLEAPMIKIGESQLTSSNEGKLIWNDEIIEKPDLSGYVTDTELNGKNYLTSSVLTDYAKKTDLNNANGVVGEIKWYSGSSVPSGYLTCNGAKVSRTTYSKLFAAIGTKWGTGDGSTTFALPNLIDRVPWGSTTAGTYKSAGLPNISGDTWLRPDDDTMSINGPFYLISSKLRNPTLGTFAGSTSEGASVGFNASKANSIYGASTTVQPPAATLIPIIKY